MMKNDRSEYHRKQDFKRTQEPRENTAVKSEFPGYMAPMLAMLTGSPFSHAGWLFEPKLDGYRLIASKNRSKTALWSRNGHSFTDRYRQIAQELTTINARYVIDGEVCYLGKNGKPDFQELQHVSAGQDQLHYYVFDLLWLNDHDLRDLPLAERKKLLRVLLEHAPPHIHFLDHVRGEGEAFFREMEKEQTEGMIAKRADSTYHAGERSKAWLKVKTAHRQEMIICGYVPSEKQGRSFSSLLCAVHENDRLVYTGRVGTGFSEIQQAEIMTKLRKLETTDCPVANPPSLSRIHWVRPQLICEVKFTAWTRERNMRHPSFIGLRTDKEPQAIRREKPVDVGESVSKVPFTNTGKVFWPDDGITKGDVIDYYRDISAIILPYLKDRPQSLYRTPNGITGKGFFQKNVGDIVPPWAATYPDKDSKGKEVTYLLCQDEDTLLYMANLGCIEINPWSSSLPDPDKPDFMIFDLDPVGVDFAKLSALAHEFKRVFDQLSIPAFCKTSGSRGLHIYVPVEKKYSYGQVQDFVRLIESHVHRKNRDLTSFERSPAAREGKIYLDYLQNGRGKTMASVYSLRPRPGAPVSAPLRWDELTPDLDPLRFTILTMRNRIEKQGDIWEGIFKQRIDMAKVLHELNQG